MTVMYLWEWSMEWEAENWVCFDGSISTFCFVVMMRIGFNEREEIPGAEQNRTLASCRWKRLIYFPLHI